MLTVVLPKHTSLKEGQCPCDGTSCRACNCGLEWNMTVLARSEENLLGAVPPRHFQNQGLLLQVSLTPGKWPKILQWLPWRWWWQQLTANSVRWKTQWYHRNVDLRTWQTISSLLQTQCGKSIVSTVSGHQMQWSLGLGHLVHLQWLLIAGKAIRQRRLQSWRRITWWHPVFSHHNVDIPACSFRVSHCFSDVRKKHKEYTVSQEKNWIFFPL